MEAGFCCNVQTLNLYQVLIQRELIKILSVNQSPTIGYTTGRFELHSDYSYLTNPPEVSRGLVLNFQCHVSFYSGSSFIASNSFLALLKVVVGIAMDLL